jgi:hypothetical protein
MTVKERVDRHDREIAAIRKLVQTGMRMLVRNEAEHEKLLTAMRELAAAQKRTEESLKSFIDSTRRSGNGHAKRKLEM